MKILILGHNGMLGNVVHKYFSVENEIVIINSRWDSDEFKIAVLESDAEFVINCIGAISQKKFDDNYFDFLNVKLPEFLETTGKKIIHPSTDCVFSGNLEPPKMYNKDDERDAYDVYGKSKAKIDKMIVDDFKNTKMIRASIIGHEIHGHVSLLDWFLSTDDDTELNGYANYYWNGITTLQWSKIAEKLMLDWDNVPIMTQVGTEGIVKSNLLRLMGKIYNKPNKINDFEMKIHLNKMLISDYSIQSMEEQLIELKMLYKK
ncbi:MAG: sugar nucleotide-binding protein [Bacteroidales bacterium]|jgi:dTDP-4-dehydrorhamnose reductase|nr:sugar nucleotide-binding protein [Bacteroidales bacterium]